MDPPKLKMARLVECGEAEYRTAREVKLRDLDGVAPWWRFARAFTVGVRVFAPRSRVERARRWARGESTGALQRALDFLAFHLIAHECHHAETDDSRDAHPSPWLPGYWFDVRAAHPLRITDKDGWGAVARELLARPTEA